MLDAAERRGLRKSIVARSDHVVIRKPTSFGKVLGQQVSHLFIVDLDHRQGHFETLDEQT